MWRCGGTMDTCRFGRKEKKGFSHRDRCFRLYCSQTSSWHTTTFPSQVVECQLSLIVPNLLELHKAAGWLFSLWAQCFNTWCSSRCLHLKSRLPLIWSQFDSSPDRLLEGERGECHPTVWKLSFSRRKPQCSPPTAFHVGMFPSLYMSCLCFPGLVSGF